MFISIFNSIPELISNAVQANPKFAYVLICLAMFLENLIPPIPSEIIMPLGGYLVYQGYLNFVIVTFFGLLGTVAGALPWYYLGKLLNEKKISKFIQKKGRLLGITEKDIEKSRFWFDKYGTSLVFWGRLVPGIRTLISIPAGIELMPLGKFLAWTSLGSLIWVILLTTAGYLLAERYMQTYEYLDNFKIFFKPILIFIVLFFIIKSTMNFKKKN